MHHFTWSEAPYLIWDACVLILLALGVGKLWSWTKGERLSDDDRGGFF